MIDAWQIIAVDKKEKKIRVDAMVKKGNKLKRAHNYITCEEWDNLKQWGFFNYDEGIPFYIFKIRQIDMLEADFKADVSELKKLAMEMEMEW